MLVSCHGSDLTEPGKEPLDAVRLPCGQKLAHIGHSDSGNYAYVTRPMREEEEPETYTVYRRNRSSSWGEDTFLLVECQ